LGSGNIDIGGGGGGTWGSITGNIDNQTDLKDKLDEKQDELVSGTNIKTINNESILGGGNVTLQTQINITPNRTLIGTGTAGSIESGYAFTLLSELPPATDDSTVYFLVDDVPPPPPPPPPTEEEFQFKITGDSFAIPVNTYRENVPYDWNVDWGDGSAIETFSGTSSRYSAGLIHNYSSSGTYTITITPINDDEGWFNAFGFYYDYYGGSGANTQTNKDKVIEILSPITVWMRPTNVTYSHAMMFAGCSNLISIPDWLLPATTLSGYCYSNMFAYCTSLTSIPAGLLPATTLAGYCYSNMFDSCTNITSIPAGLLPATILAGNCYNGMFYYCTNLTTIPVGLLPATTLASQCYANMFYYCTSLTSIPAGLLPATIMRESCYVYMFQSCSNLTNIGNIDLDWFSGKISQYGMFSGCNNITTPILWVYIPSECFVL
jgi:hypothetical protein